MAPKPPRRSERPGAAGSLLYLAWGPRNGPQTPQTFGAPRRSRVAPLNRGLSQTEGEANGAIDRRQLDRREGRQALRQRPAWNGSDGVEVHHARLRHAVARTEGHLARDLPAACRQRCDGDELSDQVDLVARQQEHGAPPRRRGELRPPHLTAAHLPVFAGKQPHGRGLGGLDVPRAFRARTIAGDVFTHGGLMHASLQPQTERSLDDGAAAEARRAPRSLHGAIELVRHADRDFRRRLGHALPPSWYAWSITRVILDHLPDATTVARPAETQPAVARAGVEAPPAKLRAHKGRVLR